MEWARRQRPERIGLLTMNTNRTHMKHYGSGARTLDESRAASCRDAIREYSRLLGTVPSTGAEALAIEARIGREYARLVEIESRLAEA
jgi:hypothetical protein